MHKVLKKHIKNNSGDMYIQMLICLTCLLGMLAFAFQITSVMTQKIWVDDKLNDIVRIVAVTGDTNTEDITEIITEVTEKLGGTVEIVPEDWLDEEEGIVQLGTIVRVNYVNETFPVIKIANMDIDIEVNLSRQGISEVYFKPGDY